MSDTPDLDKAREKARSISGLRSDMPMNEQIAYLILEQRAEEAERCSLMPMDMPKKRAADLRRQAGGGE